MRRGVMLLADDVARLQRPRHLDDVAIGPVDLLPPVAPALSLLPGRERLRRHGHTQLVSREDRRVVLDGGARLQNGGTQPLQLRAQLVLPWGSAVRVLCSTGGFGE